MELTTQAAIVSALLALLVLLVGLARRDRRRRSAEAAPEPAADVETLTQIEEPVTEEPVAEELASDEPVAAELLADELVHEEPRVAETAEEELAPEEPAEDVAVEAGVRHGGWRASRRRRRRAAAKAELDAALAPYEVTWPSLEEIAADAAAAAVSSSDEPAHDEPLVEPVADAQDAAEEGSESEVQAELRALRAQVHTLEQVLQAQLAEYPTDLAVVPTPGGEPTEDYLRQISLVVRGLAEHTDEAENPHRTLARVAAAVERLGVPNGMDRPVLPLPSDPPPHPRAGGPWKPSHRREVHELEAPAGASQPEVVPFPGVVGTLVEELVNVYSHGEVQVSPQVAELAPHVEAEPQPMVQPMPEPMPQPMPEAMVEPMPEPTQAMELPEPDQALPTYDAAEVVLPVPPPAQSQSQNTRRRFRR